MAVTQVSTLVALWSAFGLALYLVGASVPWLTRWRVLDAANARSSHQGVVPRGGGVGVLLAVVPVLLVSALLVGVAAGPLVAFVAFTLCLGALGLADDVRSLSVRVRLAVQLGLAAAFTGWQLLGPSARLDAVPLVLVGILAVVGSVGVVAVVNAFNFMDGINGISALTAAVCGGWYSLQGLRLDDGLSVLAGATLAGAAAGFLPWNAPRAVVFLGDSGSYFLGGAVAALAVVSWSAGAGLLVAVAPLSVYVADVTFTLVRRAARGERWQDAHREHVYQRLIHAQGWSHLQASLVVAGVSVACCVVVALLPAVLAALVCLSLLGAYLSLPVLVPRARPSTA